MMPKRKSTSARMSPDALQKMTRTETHSFLPLYFYLWSQHTCTAAIPSEHERKCRWHTEDSNNLDICVMVNFMCQLDRAMECQYVWSNTTVDASVRVFLWSLTFEAVDWVDCSPLCGRVSSNRVKSWTEDWSSPEEEGTPWAWMRLRCNTGFLLPLDSNWNVGSSWVLSRELHYWRSWFSGLWTQMGIKTTNSPGSPGLQHTDVDLGTCQPP